MTDDHEPEATDAEWLRDRLRRQAQDVSLDAPPEEGLHRRITSRKRKRIGTSVMVFALLAGGLGVGAVALLGDGGDNNRVQVASPDTAEQSQDDTIDGGRGLADEEARDRSGSGLVFSPLPLETAAVELPTDAQPWQLFVDGEYLYTAGPDGWLLRTSDLENWESLPTPPLAELIPGVDDAAGWPNHHFMQFGVSGEVIAALVNVFEAPPLDVEGGDHVIDDRGDDGWFTYVEDLDSRCRDVENGVGTDSVHLIVSRDGGASWTATELDSSTEDVPGDFIVPHHQAELAVADGAVVVSSTVFQELDLDCVIHGAGLIPDGRSSRGMSYGGSRIEVELDDGSTVSTTADDLGLTASQRAAMDHDDSTPFQLSALNPSGLVEVYAGVGYPELVGTSAGFLVTTFGANGIRSIDGGLTWTEVELPGWIHGHNGSTLVASDGFSSFLSDDLGTTWTAFDGPESLEIDTLARNGQHVLAVGREAFGEMAGLDYELDLSLGKDGRTMTMHQSGTSLMITVTEDVTGDVLFEAQGDLFSPEPPPGTEETPDGGIRVFDTEGETLFEATEDELNAAFEATMTENGGFDEYEYEEPETVLAHSAGDGWTVSPSSDVLGVNSWIVAVGPWADGFVVVANPIPDMAFEPDELKAGEGTFVEESYDFEPPRLVVLTPAG